MREQQRWQGLSEKGLLTGGGRAQADTFRVLCQSKAITTSVHLQQPIIYLHLPRPKKRRGETIQSLKWEGSSFSASIIQWQDAYPSGHIQPQLILSWERKWLQKSVSAVVFLPSPWQYSVQQNTAGWNSLFTLQQYPLVSPSPTAALPC